jgi:ketosteroid isomerase-like protein
VNAAGWEEALRDLRAAVGSLLTGEPEPYQQLWSRAADANMMGAYGGLDAGHDAVRAAIAHAAANYLGWRPEYHEELITAGNDGSLGYVILREHVANQNDTTVRSRRITVLLRREADQWRIFHHHSDPLHDRQPP